MERLTEAQAMERWKCPLTVFKTHCIGHECPKWQSGPFPQSVTFRRANIGWSPDFTPPSGTLEKDASQGIRSTDGWYLTFSQHYAGYNSDPTTEQTWTKYADPDKGICTATIGSVEK